MAFVGRRGQILLAVLIVTWCLLGLVFAAIPEKAAHAQAEQEAEAGFAQNSTSSFQRSSAALFIEFLSSMDSSRDSSFA